MEIIGDSLRAGIRFSKVPVTFAPGKLFYVCRVCIQDQSFNNIENERIRLLVNEAKLTGS